MNVLLTNMDVVELPLRFQPTEIPTRTTNTDIKMVKYIKNNYKILLYFTYNLFRDFGFSCDHAHGIINFTFQLSKGATSVLLLFICLLDGPSNGYRYSWPSCLATDSEFKCGQLLVIPREHLSDPVHSVFGDPQRLCQSLD